MQAASEGKLETVLQIFCEKENVSLNFKMKQNSYRFQYFKQYSQIPKGICLTAHDWSSLLSMEESEELGSTMSLA
jgi:hypothetical protein